MTSRCCGLCRHNPIWEAKRPGWLSRLWWKLAFRIGRRLMPESLTVYAARNASDEVEHRPCPGHPWLFCYDTAGSKACAYHSGSTRPEFLACKSCPAFEIKHEAPADGR